jgi:histone acetyltransferase 1
VSFRPSGKKISSYARVAPNSATKGKGAAVTLPEDDPDAVVYEVWHVCASKSIFFSHALL